MLFLTASLKVDGTLVHSVDQRPIVAWYLDPSTENDLTVRSAPPIVPDWSIRRVRNARWCYFDPESGEHWNEAGSSRTRQAALDAMLKDLAKELRR
jgi:hypothetical protein